MRNLAERRPRTKARALHDLRSMQHIDPSILAHVLGGGTDDRAARHPTMEGAPTNIDPTSNPVARPPNMDLPMPGGGGGIMPGRSPMQDYRN